MPDIGAAVGRVLPFDPTPNFQLSRNGGAIPGFGYDAAALASRQANINTNGAASSGSSNAQLAAQLAAQRGGSGSSYTYDGGGGSYSDGGSYGGGGAAAAPQDLAFLDDQENQLRSLLGRTDTLRQQGLTKLDDDLARERGGAQAERDNAVKRYDAKRVENTTTKQNNYEQINKGANNGFRSLSQIIGRASGTGSSAFRDLLPSAIGRDTSAKRMQANQTFGQNAQAVDQSQNETEVSFANILADLARQRKSGEEELLSGIESQRQTINSQLGSVAGQRAQAQGGGYEQVRAAQQPFQAAIENSRNSVEGFFNQYRTPYSRGAVAAQAPELANYTADRAEINAGNAANPGESTNPYAELLRRRQQERQL